MGLTGILIALYVRSDMLLLSWFRIDSATIALYGIAYNLVIAFQIIPTAITTTIFPRSGLGVHSSSPPARREGHVAQLSKQRRAVRIVLPRAPARLRARSVGPTVSTRRRCTPLLLIILPISLSQVATATLQASNHEVLMLRLVGVVAAVNIGLNVLLIPALGVKGAMMATMTGELCAGALTLVSMRRSGLGSVGLWYLPFIGVVFLLSMTTSRPALVSIALIGSGIALWRAGVLALPPARLPFPRRRAVASVART